MDEVAVIPATRLAYFLRDDSLTFVEELSVTVVEFFERKVSALVVARLARER